MENTIYQIGDLVYFNTSRNYCSACFIHASKVAKISKTGRLTLENGMTFNNGNQIRSKGNDYPSAYIIATEIAIEIQEDDKMRRMMNALVIEANKKIDNCRCGGGNFSLTEKQINALRTFISNF